MVEAGEGLRCWAAAEEVRVVQSPPSEGPHDTGEDQGLQKKDVGTVARKTSSESRKIRNYIGRP